MDAVAVEVVEFQVLQIGLWFIFLLVGVRLNISPICEKILHFGWNGQSKNLIGG